MKKLLFFAVALLATFQMMQAQNLETGNSLINFGIGVGGHYGVYSSYTSQTPAFGLSYDYGFKEGVGPGLITLGGYVGYKSLTYKYDYTYNQSLYYKWTWTYFIVGARGTYQYSVSDKFDLYGGLLLSMNFSKFKHESNDPDYYNYNYNYSESGSNLGLTLFGGARYGFTENIGAFAELGYGISYLTLGIGYKL